MKQNIGRGIVTVFTANIINMLFSLVTNFVLPKYLSIETYAIIKTFQLYVSYIGIFHLGFSDGLYLKYGGKVLKDIDKNEIKVSISTMTIFQIVVAGVIFAYAVIRGNCLVLIFAFDIIGFNMMGLFKSIYQALGEFNRYAKITQAVALINFFINMLLIAVVKTDNPYMYITGYVCVDICIYLYIVYDFKKVMGIKKIGIGFSCEELRKNIKNGILLLFGNLTNIILISMDRWFTKILLHAIDFAQYSFAVSVQTMLNVAISPLTITLYNYLCINQEKKKIQRLQSCIIIFSVILVSAIFPVKLVLELFLKKYYDATVVITLLFATQIFSILIQSVYVNLYKAQKKQEKYFKKVITVIIIGFILNFVFYYISRCKESFALGTFISTIIWFIFCQNDFKELKLLKVQLLYLLLETIVFIFIALKMSAISGCLLYFFLTGILTIVFMKKEILFIINLIKRNSL